LEPAGLTPDSTLASFLARFGSVRVDHRPFARGLACMACTTRKPVGLVLECSIAEGARRCACGGYMGSSPLDLVHEIRPGDFLAREQQPLMALGLRAGEVLQVADGSYVELGGL